MLFDPGTVTSARTGAVNYRQGGYYQSRADRNGVSLLTYIHAMFGLIRQRRAQSALLIGCAGGSLAINYAYNVAPRDGLTIVTPLVGAAASQAMGEDSVKYDLTRMKWIGRTADTAAARTDSANAERQRAAEAAFNDHPFVKTLIERHGATVVPGSIRPAEDQTP